MSLAAAAPAFAQDAMMKDGMQSGTMMKMSAADTTKMKLQGDVARRDDAERRLPTMMKMHPEMMNHDGMMKHDSMMKSGH